LPPSRILEDYGLDHFILFKPRDIVSGDFYWMKNRDDKVIVAAADCTGHGVPGAFMSMLGMAFLNEIVTKGEFQNAAQILDQLREHIINNLHQTGKAQETKDGMDMSLCILDKNSSQMQFAGAFNSLYMIRNGELIEANADRMPIGVHDRLNVPFTNHVIDLQKNDSVYILSDGYIDQFGGTQGKKFMAKRFKQLLLDIQVYNMPEQREFLDKTIVEWRGDIDQIDDIMVLGFKI
jgi:serine phosphatase RsbU (regulator of sigma subunit)